MDLRTIMNSDAAGVSDTASTSPAPLSRQSLSSDTGFQRPPLASSSSLPTHSYSYQSNFPGRPSQQQPPLQSSPDRASSYSSIQSPYSLNSTSGSRDTYSATTAPAIYGQSQPQKIQTGSGGGPLASPYTPGGPRSAGIAHQDSQSYFPQQHSQQFQSVTNSSFHSPSIINEYSHHLRESPHSASSQSTLQPQQTSPLAQRSLPGTPPVASASFPRPSLPTARPPSSGTESPQTQVTGHWASHDSVQAQDQRRTMSPIMRPRPSRQESKSIDGASRPYPVEIERDRTNSVSPRTVVASASRHGSGGSLPDQRLTPLRTISEDQAWKESPTGSVSASLPSAGLQPSSHPTPTRPGLPSSPSSRINLLNGGRLTDQKHTTVQRIETNSPQYKNESNPHPPKRKKLRNDEPPIFARRVRRTTGRCPVIPSPLPPIPKNSRKAGLDPWAQRNRSVPAAMPVPQSLPPDPRGEDIDRVMTAKSPVATRTLPPDPPLEGSLGPWEPSITGFIPHEEITKMICDFLFEHVVLRKDINVSHAGSAATGQGAIIEVEAKLGQIKDLDRGDRLRLPIFTESILKRDDPGLRTAFESSMTLNQHRAMNNFLNEAVKESLPMTNPGRIPLSYAHKRERDTFYEIAPADLPPIIRHNLHPRHKPKVRVTTDQRTGKVISQIVKCRIADLDVYSPSTFVDWRVSVNIEMEYDGDVRQLTVADGTRSGKGGERNKDRMSYRHLAYQIDLTQVAKSESSTKPEFEHELEIEISAAEVRRQGELAMSGDPKNQYEELIKCFVDNIRLLARAVPNA